MVELAALCVVIVVGIPLALALLNVAVLMAYYLAKGAAYFVAGMVGAPFMLSYVLWKAAWIAAKEVYHAWNE
jgi:hypothetical protein